MKIPGKMKVVVLAVVDAGLASIYISSWRGPALRYHGLVRVTVSHEYFVPNRDRQKPGQWRTVEKSSSVPEGMARVITVVNSGRRTKSHKCAGSAELTFQYLDGVSRRLGFSFGHDAEFCEVAENGTLYRMPRKAFLDALAALGINQEMLHGGLAVEQADEPRSRRRDSVVSSSDRNVRRPAGYRQTVGRTEYLVLEPICQ